MSYGRQRIIIGRTRGVGALYIPINRYCDDVSLTVVDGGGTYTVDYTLENIIRAPGWQEPDGTDLTTGAAATWSNLSLTADAFIGKLSAYALRLDVTVVADAVIAAAIAEDGGVFTDETTEANEATADDMTLFPATPVAAIDRYNFGFATQTNDFEIDVSTAGTGTYTVVWEYWNGSAWAALQDVVDDTVNFKTAGRENVAWTVPSDWALSKIDGLGPFYYIRAEIQTGTVTITPIGERAFDLDTEAVIRIAQS
jgi:hypothetical protein